VRDEIARGGKVSMTFFSTRWLTNHRTKITNPISPNGSREYKRIGGTTGMPVIANLFSYVATYTII